MKTLFGSAVAFAWCVAVPFAQQQPAPAAAPTPEPAHKVFLLSGCLEVGTGAIPTYKLTDASPIGQARVRAVEAGAVGTSGEKASYVLQPDSGVNAQGMDAKALQARAGQRVEATLRPIEKPAEAPPLSGATVTLAPAPERYTVTEIKRVTGTCP